MRQFSYVMFFVILTLIISANAFAFKIGQKIPFNITVTNSSSTVIKCGNKIIPTKKKNVVVEKFVDTIKSPESNFSHSATILSKNGEEICTVTAYIDIETSDNTISIWGDSTNISKCDLSNGIEEENGEGVLFVTVSDDF